jgi:hypothetical protein
MGESRPPPRGDTGGTPDEERAPACRGATTCGPGPEERGETAGAGDTPIEGRGDMVAAIRGEPPDCFRGEPEEADSGGGTTKLSTYCDSIVATYWS